MVDTARHFETLASLKAIVASLPYSKINVLHWHISDSQSFPMQSFSHHKLWNGAFSDQERYTQADISTVVEWARLHGVRVIVEFDMPGHAASWCAGYPEVCPSTTCTQPLNVASNKTFELITDLLGEMTGGKTSAPGAPSGLFPDNFIHLGYLSLYITLPHYAPLTPHTIGRSWLLAESRAQGATRSTRSAGIRSRLFPHGSKRAI